MRGITPITFEFVYVDKPESKQRLADAYHRIFRQAWKNILDKQSTVKYSGNTYDKPTTDGRVSDARGNSKDSQGQVNNDLQDGPQREDTGREVRQSVENKLKTSPTTS